MAYKKFTALKSPYIEHIVSTLEQRIRSGVYPGGRWLPTERELCAEFEVSRATLRQALIKLENDSFVIRSAGCRPFVTTDRNSFSGENGHHRSTPARMTIGLCAKHDYKYSGT